MKHFIEKRKCRDGAGRKKNLIHGAFDRLRHLEKITLIIPGRLAITVVQTVMVDPVETKESIALARMTIVPDSYRD